MLYLRKSRSLQCLCFVSWRGMNCLNNNFKNEVLEHLDFDFQNTYQSSHYFCEHMKWSQAHYHFAQTVSKNIVDSSDSDRSVEVQLSNMGSWFWYFSDKLIHVLWQLRLQLTSERIRMVTGSRGPWQIHILEEIASITLQWPRASHVYIYVYIYLQVLAIITIYKVCRWKVLKRPKPLSF